MNLFELFAKLSLDTSDYEKGLKDSETKTKSFSGKVGTALKVVGGGAAAFAAAGAAVYGMSKKTADATDHIDKMSQKLGISRDPEKARFDQVFGIYIYPQLFRELSYSRVSPRRSCGNMPGAGYVPLPGERFLVRTPLLQ